MLFSPRPRSSRAAPHKTHRKVISLDGFPAYALNDPQAADSTLRKLAQQGVVAASMKTGHPP